MAQAWRRAWQEVIPFFAFGPEIRRVIYTTNAIEGLNRIIRKAIKTRGSFPSEDAAEMPRRHPDRSRRILELLPRGLQRAETGITPDAFVTEARVAHVARLLAEGGLADDRHCWACSRK